MSEKLKKIRFKAMKILRFLQSEKTRRALFRGKMRGGLIVQLLQPNLMNLSK